RTRPGGAATDRCDRRRGICAQLIYADSYQPAGGSARSRRTATEGPRQTRDLRRSVFGVMRGGLGIDPASEDCGGEARVEDAGDAMESYLQGLPGGSGQAPALAGSRAEAVGAAGATHE